MSSSVGINSVLMFDAAVECGLPNPVVQCHVVQESHHHASPVPNTTTLAILICQGKSP